MPCRTSPCRTSRHRFSTFTRARAAVPHSRFATPPLASVLSSVIPFGSSTRPADPSAWPCIIRGATVIVASVLVAASLQAETFSSGKAAYQTPDGKWRRAAFVVDASTVEVYSPRAGKQRTLVASFDSGRIESGTAVRRRGKAAIIATAIVGALFGATYFAYNRYVQPLWEEESEQYGQEILDARLDIEEANKQIANARGSTPVNQSSIQYEQMRIESLQLQI